jgi:hypothetical protein
MRSLWAEASIAVLIAAAGGYLLGNLATTDLVRRSAPADGAPAQTWADRFHQSPSASVDQPAADQGYIGPSGGSMAGTDPATLDRGYDQGSATPVPAPDPAALQRLASACDTCSDYDLGYRWAEQARVGDVSQCLGFTSSYQRGCIEFARGGRGRRRDPDA